MLLYLQLMYVSERPVSVASMRLSVPDLIDGFCMGRQARFSLRKSMRQCRANGATMLRRGSAVGAAAGPEDMSEVMYEVMHEAMPYPRRMNSARMTSPIRCNGDSS